MGVLMHKHRTNNTRSRLTVLGMVAVAGLFSIAPVSTAAASPAGHSTSVASDSTPGGVFGWD
jgi:hypothetical protein